MTAHLRAEVKDYTKTYFAVKRFVSFSGGYIANENEEKNSYYINNSLVIKIPSEYFSSVVDSIEHNIPDLLEKRIVADDVTAKFYDLEARIKTKKNVEARYISILNKATTIKEILKVEREIGLIREEIESSEGKLKLMSKLVRYSTIYLTLNQPFNEEPTYAESPTFWTRTAKGFISGLDGILSILIGFTYMWPVFLFGFFGFWLVRRILRKKWNFSFKPDTVKE